GAQPQVAGAALADHHEAPGVAVVGVGAFVPAGGVGGHAARAGAADDDLGAQAAAAQARDLVAEYLVDRLVPVDAHLSTCRVPAGSHATPGSLQCTANSCQSARPGAVRQFHPLAWP